MYGRWEIDDDAVVLPPYGCDDLDQRRRQRLQFVGLILDRETRQAINAVFPIIHSVMRYCCMLVCCRLHPL